jgi:uncharacterized protein YraI
MKRFSRWIIVVIIAALVLPMLSPPTPVEAQAVNGMVANASRVNLRSGPGANYPRVLVMSAGQQFLILGTNADGSWMNVRLISGIDGWIRADFVQTIRDVGQVPVTAPTGRFNAVVTAYYLNIRNGPGANFEQIGRLANGNGFDVTGRNADASWVQINVPGGIQGGWVSGRYVSSNIRIWDLPIVSNTGVFPTYPQPVPASGQTGIITANNLNVRMGPGTYFNRFTTLRNGEGVSLIGRNGYNNWLLIQMADGRTGWVNSGFIFTNYPIGNLPIRG